MTWWHPIWTPPRPDEMSAGKAAVAKAMAMKSGTDRERRFITALNAYYNTPDGARAAATGQSCHGPVGPRDRVVAYEKAMRELYERYPDDFETRVFYALAVLAVGYATPTDATLSHQLQAAAILEKLWATNRNHPGAAHYLIHCYDYPALATRAWRRPAATDRAVGSARAAHALAHLHPPRHVGRIDRANRSAADAAQAYAAARHRTATEAKNSTRAITWPTPTCRKRDTEAKKVVDFAATVRNEPGTGI